MGSHRSSSRAGNAPRRQAAPPPARERAQGVAARLSVLRERLGNAGLSRLLRSAQQGSGARTPAPVIQRDLLVYTKPQLKTYAGIGLFGSSGSTYSADAAAVTGALSTLTLASKVNVRAYGDGTIYSAAPAEKAAVEAALVTFPRPADMATAITARNELSVYAHERVDRHYGLWTTTTGTAADVIEKQSRRPLTGFERAEAKLVFGPGLKYDAIILEDDPLMSIGNYARTTPTAINLPPGQSGKAGFMPLLIHELTHSWQYQHGTSLSTTFYHAIASTYDYGGEAGLIAATASGKKLSDFNTEQQGDIACDYYKRLKAGTSTAAWAPFIAELQVP